ncbi:MAG: hypothetical protein UHL07_04190, partial [Bacteroidaceae bacterium]|nr:hypothetical protein [Bacteroidaceae bacterium]
MLQRLDVVVIILPDYGDGVQTYRLAQGFVGIIRADGGRRAVAVQLFIYLKSASNLNGNLNCSKEL